MWGSILNEAQATTNFNFSFSTHKSDILMHLSQWQYWWWFWFALFWTVYFFIIIRIINKKTFSFNPTLNTSIRGHGKWGDFLVALIPLSWCGNILVNSNFILRMIEWQNESSLFTIRVQGKQWYWVYKYDASAAHNIFTAPKNIGRNKWLVSTKLDIYNADNYYQALHIGTQLEYKHLYYKHLSDESISTKLLSKSDVNSVVEGIADFKNKSYKKLSISDNVIKSRIKNLYNYKIVLKNFKITNKSTYYINKLKEFFSKNNKFISTSDNKSNIFIRIKYFFFKKKVKDNYKDILIKLKKRKLNLGRIKHLTNHWQYKDFPIVKKKPKFTNKYINSKNKNKSTAYYDFSQIDDLSNFAANVAQQNSNKPLCILKTPLNKHMRLLIKNSCSKSLYNRNHILYLFKKLKSYNKINLQTKKKLSYNIKQDYLNNYNLVIKYKNIVSRSLIKGFLKNIYKNKVIRSKSRLWLYERSIIKYYMKSIRLWMFRKDKLKIIKSIDIKHSLRCDFTNKLFFKFTDIKRRKLLNKILFKIKEIKIKKINKILLQKKLNYKVETNVVYLILDRLKTFRRIKPKVYKTFSNLDFKIKSISKGCIRRYKKFMRYTNLVYHKDNTKAVRYLRIKNFIFENFPKKNKLSIFLKNPNILKKIKDIYSKTFKLNSNKVLLKSNIAKTPILFTTLFIPNDVITEKIEDNELFWGFRQKKYKRFKNYKFLERVYYDKKTLEPKQISNDIKTLKTLKTVKNLAIKGSLNKDLLFSDNNVADYQRSLKFNRHRSELVPVNLARRLLRTKRTLVLPAHVNITLISSSYDVVHSWFIPGLGLKIDCVPGRSTHHSFYIDNIGFYYGQCAEICGRFHHHMPIRLCALSFDHFLVWWHKKGLKRLHRLNLLTNKKDKKSKLINPVSGSTIN